jgi:hypothetical protein
MDESEKEFGNCINCGAFVSFLDHSLGIKNEKSGFKVEIPMDIILKQILSR